MKFIATPLSGAWLVEMEPAVDERGFFARTWCAEEFRAQGLKPFLAQCSISANKSKGTLRGMHFQQKPHEETKLVWCPAGAIYDVIVDLRPGSKTCCNWFGAVLTPTNGKMLYVPEGFAHAFQTLADNSAVYYHISEAYHPESARGVRWNDPAFAIHWPIPDPILSARDRGFPDFKP